MRALLTGFGPFDAVTDNPTATVAAAIATTAGPDLHVEVLPVVWQTAPARVAALYGELHPDVGVHLGVAAGSDRMRLERRARAVATRPDSTGAWPTTAPCAGEVRYPVEAAAAALARAGVPTTVSDDAGSYLCNAALAAALQVAAAETLVAFLHVPMPGTPWPGAGAAGRLWHIDDLDRGVRHLLGWLWTLARARRAVAGRPVALIGPMGAGKSTVAPLVASRLGRRSIDTDRAVAAATGCAPAAWLAGGDANAWRMAEAAVLGRALRGASGVGAEVERGEAGRDVVIACGGGAHVTEAGAEALAAAAVVALVADPPLLTSRVVGDRDTARPLAAGIAGDAPLLRERREATAAAAQRVVAALGTPDSVADAVIASLAATPMDVAPAAHDGRAPSALFAGVGAWDVGAAAIAAAAGGRLALVSDETVGALHVPEIAATLRGLGCQVEVHTVAGGEAAKTLAQWSTLVTDLVAAGADRDLLVVGVGGGVACDMAGFAAATALRGVRLALVPTTLLAQVDAAHGGKNGVDAGGGKNLVGTFYPPRWVVTDPRWLTTLPAAEVRSGMAEVVKTALVASPPLWQRLWQRAPLWASLGHHGLAVDDRLAAEEVGALVAACAAAKRAVTDGDPREQGQRRLLNFGHTLGHALEARLGLGALRHGEAVAIGMRWALDLGVALGVTPAPLRDDAVRLLHRLGLATLTPAGISPRDLLAQLGRDKKSAGAAVRWVLVEAVGKARVQLLTAEEVAAGLGW